MTSSFKSKQLESAGKSVDMNRIATANENVRSDVHFWKRGAIGELKVEGNCILGHEAAGLVLEVGEGVTTVRQGDRVAIEPQVPCGTCFSCTSGRTNLCPQVKFIGVYPYHGSLQRFKVHPARYVHK